MPNNVVPVEPVDVLPIGLYSAFGEDLRLESLINDYQDGNSQRCALAINPRTFFRLTRPLTPSQWRTLRDFYAAHVGLPFYFYAPRETVPPWMPDPTGEDPIGRYTVVFDGAWSEEIRLGRSQAGFGLRVVEVPILGDPTDVTLSILTSAENPPDTYTGLAQSVAGPTEFSATYGSPVSARSITAAGWTSTTDTISLTSLGLSMADLQNLWVSSFIDGTVSGDGLNRYHIEDCYLTLTYPAPAVLNVRPTIFHVVPASNPAVGTVVGTEFGAFIERYHWGLSSSAAFSVTGFAVPPAGRALRRAKSRSGV